MPVFYSLGAREPALGPPRNVQCSVLNVQSNIEHGKSNIFSQTELRCTREFSRSYRALGLRRKPA